MRIALFHNLSSGGGKRTLHEEVRRLSTRHHIDVFTLTSANHDFADLRPHVATHRVYDFQPLPLLSSPFGRLNQATRLADLMRLRTLHHAIARDVRQGNYDVLFVHPCRYETSPSILRYTRKLPSVYYCHESLRRLYEPQPARPYDDTGWQATLNRVDPLIALYHTILKRTDRHNVLSANKVLVNSQFTQQTARAIYRVDAQVSYHGVDVNWFRPLQMPKRHMVLSVGSLTPLKGFDFLVEAVGHIPAGERPPLVIASNFQNPPERAYLERLAQERGVDLQLMGNVSDECLRQLYNEAQVVAYAPIREPFGLVPLEAMACGTPVVAVREGGIQETIVHEETGLLVERDPIQFAAALQRLLSDPTLAAAYGRAGRAHVAQQWTWDVAAATLDDHLEAAASGSGQT